MNPYIYSILPSEIQRYVMGNTVGMSLHMIIEDVFGVPRGELFNKSRKREIVNGRQLYCSIMCHTTRMSYAAVGLYAGGKDHATVLHSCKAVSLWLAQEKDFREKVIQILYRYYAEKYKLMGEDFIKQSVSNTITEMITNKGRQKPPRTLQLVQKENKELMSA